MNKLNKAKAAVMALPITAMSAMTVFAGDTAGTANNDVVSAMTTVAGDMRATGNAIIPVALTVVGLGLVVVFGVRIFRKVAK